MATCCVAVYEEVHMCCKELRQLAANVKLDKADPMSGGAGMLQLLHFLRAPAQPRAACSMRPQAVQTVVLLVSIACGGFA